jgi:phosphohistidine phosphatase
VAYALLVFVQRLLLLPGRHRQHRVTSCMDVYFLRHGIAEERDAWHGSDFERPLTPEGRERMRREAKALAKLPLAIDAVLTSPLVRAHETATIVAAGLRVHGAPVVDARLGAEFDIDQLRAMLAEHSSAGAVMLVGHEPNMGETVGRLVGGANLVLKKGGLAYVALESAAAERGTLRWLLPPKFLD